MIKDLYPDLFFTAEQIMLTEEEVVLVANDLFCRTPPASVITLRDRAFIDEGRSEHPTLVLHPQDPVDGLVDALLGELAGSHRGEHRVVGLVDRRRHQQLVDAGLERQHRDAVVAVLRAHAGHGERVGDDNAVVAQLVP